jgi:tetratricopeptide (TPR) repeat protein
MLLLGQDGLRQGDFAFALDYAQEILEIAPSKEAYSLCGDACLGLKNYDKAIECYAKARRIDAAVAEAYFRKSQLLNAAGQRDQAAEILKHAVSLDPDVVNRLR